MGGGYIYPLTGGDYNKRILNSNDIYSFFERANGDLLFTKDDTHIFKVTGDDTFDTVVTYTTGTRPRMAEKDGVLYFSNMQDGKIYKIENYNTTPVEVASVSWVNQICFNAEGNILANDQYGHTIYEVELPGGTSNVIFDYDSLTIAVLAQFDLAFHATSGKMYAAGSTDIQKLYTIDSGNTITEIKIDDLRMGYGMVLYNDILYILADRTTIYTVTIK